ncbi:MAG TPA: hypothetical protein VG841_15785 [Caulobacterales bacterium]|nr:hypothetical protein [Caulobacterales bacterium]
MRTPAKQIVEIGDALRRHALDCGADMNAANLFAHAVLMRALAADADLAHVAVSEEAGHACDWDIRGQTFAA